MVWVYGMHTEVHTRYLTYNICATILISTNWGDRPKFWMSFFSKMKLQTIINHSPSNTMVSDQGVKMSQK